MLSGKSFKRKAVVVFACMLCAAFTLLPLTAFADGLQPGYWGNTTANSHSGGNENITIAKVNDAGKLEWEHIAYCFNVKRDFPQGAYDGTTNANEYGELALQDDASWKSLSENPGYAGEMKDILTKIIYVGYPYDSNDATNPIRTSLKEDCQVEDADLDDAFRLATQMAVWHVTDNRSFSLPSDGCPPHSQSR